MHGKAKPFLSVDVIDVDAYTNCGVFVRAREYFATFPDVIATVFPRKNPARVTFGKSPNLKNQNIK